LLSNHNLLALVAQVNYLDRHAANFILTPALSQFKSACADKLNRDCASATGTSIFKQNKTGGKL
jgi:hypothetical protein